MAKPPSKPPATQQTSIVSAQWSGPLPPPDALAHFNEIIPNGAERIMAMVEEEQRHRIQIETKAFQAESGDFRRGQYIGAVTFLACVISAVIVVWLGGHPAVSVALVSVPIMTFLGRFFQRYRKDSNNK